MNKLKCPMCEGDNIVQYKMMTGKIWCGDCGFTAEHKEIDNPFVVEEVKMKGLHLIKPETVKLEDDCYLEIDSILTETVTSSIGDRYRIKFKLINDFLNEMGYKIVKEEI